MSLPCTEMIASPKLEIRPWQCEVIFPRCRCEQIFRLRRCCGARCASRKSGRSELIRILLRCEFSPPMPTSLLVLLVTLLSIHRSGVAVQLENLTLCHQIGVQQRSVKERPKWISAHSCVASGCPSELVDLCRALCAGCGSRTMPRGEDERVMCSTWRLLDRRHRMPR